MRVLAIGAAVAVVVAAGGCAQPPSKQLIALETRWMDAMQMRDRATLEQLMAAEFTLAGQAEEGRPAVGRAAWLDNTLRHLDLQTAHVDSAVADVTGDMGRVTAVLTWAGSYDGEAFRETVRLVDTWKRRDGRWQVVSRRVHETIGP